MKTDVAKPTNTVANEPAMRHRANRKHGLVARTAFVSVWLLLAISTASAAEDLTARQAIERQAEWPTWARQRTALRISGRFEGRAGGQFRLEKLPIMQTPARGTVLANDVRVGQRLTLTGTLRESGRKFYLDVNRISIDLTDGERLAAQVRKADSKDPAALYKLADDYQPIADFYEDEELAEQIKSLRRTAFDQQRQQRKDDPAALLQLAEAGATAGIAESVTDAIKFESLVVRSKSASANRTKLMKDLQSQLDGWDRHNQFPDKAAEERFLKDMVGEYEKADSLNRQRMHRRFYQRVRSEDILKNLKPDGSNGLEIAAKLTADVPEEKAQIARAQSLYVEYRLQRVPEMSRQQLDDVETLLRQSGRSGEFTATLKTWLAAQEKRLNNGELDGMLQLANQYLFAFERWKNLEHSDAGIDLLKKAWQLANKAAPKEAASILQLLEKRGWTRLDDRWMTTQDLKKLPRDDIALALREHRVVAGMTRSQIVAVMGLPKRPVKVVSGLSVQEIWVYGDQRSSRITVHLERSRFAAPEDAVAILVNTGR
ncbi:hypothetical protein [Fuerstiella marisgermanici]|uniref:Uncharacterized protein n=1 Tax=Fuerstiella marisgermanici TaxID=1891926 RepID=A0A1P8WJS7_9PLAN|nr:hypothetical protein [Fuerstiella marisgermanici]APZ94310.1 hypothetical protein Fuma_03936 [Fuerstiella marisgermanici]